MNPAPSEADRHPDITTELTLKVVIRCRDFAVSRDFYARVLGLPTVEEWNETQGKGCIFAFSEDRRGGCLEVYEMTERDARFDPRFREPVTSDKIDVQLGTTSVDAWAKRLQGVWPFEGPEDLPWGQRWIRLRDPDGLLIAIYSNRSLNTPETASTCGGASTL